MINITIILKHNVIGKLLNHLLVFFINVMIVRLLGAGISGFYFNELYLLNFVVFIFSAGLDYAAISVISRNPLLLPAINRIFLMFIALFLVVLLLFVFLIFQYTNDYFLQQGFAIIYFSIGNLLLIFYQGILSALKKFNLQNIILGSTNLLYLVYLFIFLKPGEVSNLVRVSGSYAILFFIQGCMMVLFSDPGWKKTKDKLNWKTFFRSGIYIMISSLVYFAFLRVDNFYVQKYENSTTLGNYVQCGKIGQYFLYFSSIISSTLLPFIANESIGSSFTEWKKMMKPYILLLCAAAVFIAVTGHFLFPFFFGTDFLQMNSFMIILLPGFVCLGMLTLLNAVYIGKGNIKKIFIGDIIGLILVSGFDNFLVPKYGAYAAAIISSISYCIVFFYLLSGFKEQFVLPPTSPSTVNL
ncbi:MAG: polysaccharide biosynthesis C-terminal domain-containing protein [Ferruginibacter sp.]